MYRDKKYQENGFESHEEFVEMIRWLRDLGLTQESIGRLYGVTKMYVCKLTHDINPPQIINRKPRQSAR